MADFDLALGLYSIYDDWQAAPESSLGRVASLGYQGIEFYGEAVCPPSVLARWLRAAGLRNVGWHTEWRRLQPERLDRTLDDLQEAGTGCIIVPALGGPWEIGHTLAEDGPQVWEGHAAWLSDLAKEVEARDLRLGYHTHEHEFETRYDGGETPWRILCQQVSPSVVLEVDTGNCLAAGVDPVAVIRAVPGRVGQVHLKPFSKQAGWETTLGAPDDASDWPAVLIACAEAGTRWLVVEHESTRVAPGFSGAEAGLVGLRAALAQGQG